MLTSLHAAGGSAFVALPPGRVALGPAGRPT